MDEDQFRLVFKFLYNTRYGFVSQHTLHDEHITRSVELAEAVPHVEGNRPFVRCLDVQVNLPFVRLDRFFE